MAEMFLLKVKNPRKQNHFQQVFFSPRAAVCQFGIVQFRRFNRTGFDYDAASTAFPNIPAH